MPISRTLPGMEMLVSMLQEEKEKSPSCVTLSGIWTEDKEDIMKKALSPMLVTVSGMMMLSGITL